VAALLVLGAWLRLRHSTTAFLFGDELHSLRLLALPYRDLFATFDMQGSSFALPILQKAAIDLLGARLVALRLPAILPGIATLCLLPCAGRRLVSPTGALFATALLATSTFHVFYSGFGRSYSLIALIALLVVIAATRVLADVRPGPGPYAALAVTGGVLPWVHLETSTFVLAVAVTTVVAAALLPNQRRRVPFLLLAFGASAALAVALLFPDWPHVFEYVARKHHDGAARFGLTDAATVLAGSATGGLVLIALVPLGAALVVQRLGAARVPLAVAALAQLPIVFALEPFGGPYAFARYCTAALPAAALVCGELLAWIAALARVDRAAPWSAVLLGGALALVGPLEMTDDGPYANTYLSLAPLPAFDVAFPAMPEAYRRLEPNALIVEAPAIEDKSRQLYRNYYLQHRRPTLIGYLPEDGPTPPGPHVAIGPPWDLEKRADYLVLHRDVASEVDRYWHFVYQEALPRVGGATSLMHQLANFDRTNGRLTLRRPTAETLAVLGRRYGPPLYEDASVVVYRLRRPHVAPTP